MGPARAVKGYSGATRVWSKGSKRVKGRSLLRFKSLVKKSVYILILQSFHFDCVQLAIGDARSRERAYGHPGSRSAQGPPGPCHRGQPRSTSAQEPTGPSQGSRGAQGPTVPCNRGQQGSFP